METGERVGQEGQVTTGQEGVVEFPEILHEKNSNYVNINVFVVNISKSYVLNCIFACTLQLHRMTVFWFLILIWHEH